MDQVLSLHDLENYRQQLLQKLATFATTESARPVAAQAAILDYLHKRINAVERTMTDAYGWKK
jgi:hypothetical protein